jgi:hypothetical protein
MTQTTIEGLAARLEQVERDVQKWRRVATVAAAIAIAALAIGARTLRAPTEIRVASAKGTAAELVLEADRLTFFDDARLAAASITVDHGVARIGLNGKGGASAEMSADAKSAVRFTAPNDRAAELGVGDQFSEMELSHGSEHVSLRAANGLDSVLTLGAPESGTSVLSSGGAKLTPRLKLATKDAKATVAIEANTAGGSIEIADPSARRQLTSAADAPSAEDRPAKK